LKGRSFIIQGFGNVTALSILNLQVGYYASKYMVNYGAKLIGVAEYDGSIYNPNGIDPEDLQNYKMRKNGIKGYPKAGQYW
jgi:glutamate dehydrogenase (NAD(P)+)